MHWYALHFHQERLNKIWQNHDPERTVASQKKPGKTKPFTYQRLNPVPDQTDPTRESAICCLHDCHHFLETVQSDLERFEGFSMSFHVFPWTKKTVPCWVEYVECSKVKAWQACRPRWPQWIQPWRWLRVQISHFPQPSPQTLLLLVICYGVLLCFAGRNTSPHLESWEVWI